MKKLKIHFRLLSLIKNVLKQTSQKVDTYSTINIMFYVCGAQR